ncbi:MAG: LdpA C-terminal domain-containing domain [Cyanobacteria bacterium J06621_11]
MNDGPIASLQSGHWFKLICGASYQALPAVRNLALAYAIAGADCIDIAADPAVVAAAKEGLAVAENLIRSSLDWQDRQHKRPWLMASISAGEDPHFRKAWFNTAVCPSDCPRPCEQVCPAAAIDQSGVIRDRCYGCGRCLPICPLGLIEAQQIPTTVSTIASSVLSQVDALEIHTHVGGENAFSQLWESIVPWMSHLRLVSISCPDAVGLIDYLKALQQITGLSLNFEASDKMPVLMWQTDGRPMSGDIGKGTTRATIRLAQKVLTSDLAGHVQLAGGTNEYTVLKLRELGLLSASNEVATRPRTVSGIAYGSFARRLLMPVIEQTYYLEEVPQALQKAVNLADSLVSPLKDPSKYSSKSTLKRVVTS